MLFRSYSGSPIGVTALATAMSIFRCGFVQLYGLTEATGAFAQLSAEEHDPHGPRADLLGSSGRPYPWVTVRTVDPERRHLLTVLQCHFVHAHRVHALVQLGLRASGTDCVTERSGEVTDLTDVDRDIGVVRARGNGERVPLVLGHGRQLQEEPLTSLVLERGLGELNLNDIWGKCQRGVFTLAVAIVIGTHHRGGGQHE